MEDPQFEEYIVNFLQQNLCYDLVKQITLNLAIHPPAPGQKYTSWKNQAAQLDAAQCQIQEIYCDGSSFC